VYPVTDSPTNYPTVDPTSTDPTLTPIVSPSNHPSVRPTGSPSTHSTVSPTIVETISRSISPTSVKVQSYQPSIGSNDDGDALSTKDSNNNMKYGEMGKNGFIVLMVFIIIILITSIYFIWKLFIRQQYKKDELFITNINNRDSMVEVSIDKVQNDM
jgi:hypothetical protein